MSYAFRHGAALRKLDEQNPAKLRVSPPCAPPLPTYDYWCHECADEVIGDEWNGRLHCERCGAEPPNIVRKEDL